MAPYVKNREGILTIASVIGIAISSVLFVYDSNEIKGHFDVAWMHRFTLLCCVLVFLLPTLVSYIAVYFLNRIVINGFCTTELEKQERLIARSLVEAHIGNTSVDLESRDLLAEEAWNQLASFWRPR